MIWKRYETMHSRTVQSRKGNEVVNVLINQGRVSTGKTRQFTYYFTKIEAEGHAIVKENSSLYISFRQATGDFFMLGYELKLFGLQKDYRESGMSENSGYGYQCHSNNSHPVLMIDPVEED